jgi:hypothetical protein
MARSATNERIRTYLFGVAIGSLLVAVFFMARAKSVRPPQGPVTGQPTTPAAPAGQP